jgi:hypothetical protein
MTELAQAEGHIATETAAARWRTPAFILTLMLSAGLLFVVQPMFAKLVLPLFGGTPAVWNTAMVFFQAALLAGYAYAHGIASHLSLRNQVMVHGVLLAAALLTMPIGLPLGWVPSPGTFPGFALIGAMALAIGVPFVLVSATAPLLQSWFAKASGARGEDPYFLYAASNFGSLLALIAYPLAVEPTLELGEQTAAWSAGFILLMALVIGCGLIALRARADAREDGRLARGPAAAADWAAPITMGQRLHWVALAFVPSSLLLGATTYITTDIASVPLLWVIPLTLYLLSFVIAFAAKPFPPHRWVVLATPYVIAVFLLLQSISGSTPLLLLTVHLTLMLVLALMCHGELARYRPPASQLTEFYLLVSVGGVLGGIFNALIAPLIFSDVYEYPLAIVFACLLLPGYGRQPRLLTAVLFGLVILAGALGLRFYDGGTYTTVFVGTGILAVLAFGAFPQPLRFGLAVGALLATPFIWRAIEGNRVEETRSFFGVHTVSKDATGKFHIMRHGTTLHGAQFIDPARHREPLTYYAKTGPIGDAFDVLDPGSLREVGVVGLGTGSTACYKQPGQNWTYFEIDPTVIETASSGRHFTFIPLCAPDARMVVGDARLSLVSEPDHHYDLLLLDAFSSDAIPVHLLTREAMALYLRKLSPTGLLLIHVSNRYLDLTGLVANLADEKGLRVFEQNSNPTDAEAADSISGAQWMAITRNEATISDLIGRKAWQVVHPDPEKPLWTDSYSNLIRILK